MNPFQQPFKFPKRVWLVTSAAVFLYLLLAVRIVLPGKAPENFTAWKALVGGSLDDSIVMGLVAGLFWLALALAVGAFVAAILGILKQLLWGSK